MTSFSHNEDPKLQQAVFVATIEKEDLEPSTLIKLFLNNSRLPTLGQETTDELVKYANSVRRLELGLKLVAFKMSSM